MNPWQEIGGLAVLILMNAAGIGLAEEEAPALEHRRPARAEVSVESDHSGNADTGFSQGRRDVRTWAQRLDALYFPTVRRNLHLRIGGAWHRWRSGTEASTVPGTLHEAFAVLGMDWRLSRRWDLRFEVHPGLYGDFSDIHGGTVNVPILSGVSFFASQRLHVLAGFFANPRSGTPVLPFVGARWQIDERWTLDLVAPRPRVRFRVNPDMTLWSGLEVRGGTYRVGRTFGSRSGDARLNGDLLGVREFRAGGGVEWDLGRGWGVEAAGGVVLERRLRYEDADVTYYSKRAPFVTAALHYRWAR